MIIIFILSFLVFQNAFSQEPVIREIDSLYNHAQAIQKLPTSPQCSLFRLWDEKKNDYSKWIVNPDSSDEIMVQLNLYYEGNQISSAWLFETSPSGDWVKYTEHYFWPNGKTCLVVAELRTFEGDAIVDRRSYFDSTGHNILKTKKVRDLKTGLERTVDVDNYIDNPPEIYPSFKELVTKMGIEKFVKR